MSTYVKGLLQKDIERKFEGVNEFLVIDMKGITGNENNEMRGELKKKGIMLSVVKNALMSRAMDSLGIAEAKSLFEAGPSAVLFGGDSVVDVAKEFADWSKKISALSVKGAFVDGEVLGSEAAACLSKMPSRTELQGAIVMLANSPGRRIAGALVGPGGIIAGCIKGLVEKLEKEAA
jgi:large subunit ribosomal protein L10